ncbi:MAG TPA: tetratricopeptide repeat protein [Vicinamibacterales bacterium]|nr:tetratricopeptide repeat protein [Vicinamibacterales bacterium]
MLFARAFVLIGLAATPAIASASAREAITELRRDDQTATAAPQDPKAQAQYEFMMGRRMESAGDIPGALASLERARKLDPGAAEIPAEIAGYYYRQNRPAEAVTAAEQALKIDKDNVEAHNILGTVFAVWADGGSPPPAGRTQDSTRDAAIEHLTAILNTPLMATNPNLQMTLGRLQLRAGKTELAVPILEKVAAQAPWSPQPLLLLYEAQISEGKLDEAERWLMQAAEIDPRYFAQLGQFYERQGKWGDSAGAYEQAIGNSRQPSRDLQIRYAAALMNMDGGGAKAREVLNELLKTNPNDARALYLLSTAERTSGDNKAAEAAARKMMSINPTDIAGLRALVAALFDRFDYKQIVDLVTPLLKDPSRAKGRESDGAAVLVHLGIAQQQQANWDASIAAFTAARALTPDDPDLDAYLVQAHLTARRFDRAETLAREALARDADQPRMVRLRAQALLKTGKAAEATRLLEDGMAKRPTSREYMVGLADIYADQKRTDDALRLLEQARKLFGDDQTLTMRVANVYEGGGRLPDAEKELRKLMADDPLNADAMNSLSYMLSEHNQRLPEAVDLAQRALKVEPGNPAYLDTLGWALFKQGRTDEAVEPLSKAAAMLTANSVIQDHHGDVLAKRGRNAEAIAAWQRALGGDGETIDRAAIEKKIKAAKAKGK